jgi:hypothetical protein
VEHLCFAFVNLQAAIGVTNYLRRLGGLWGALGSPNTYLYVLKPKSRSHGQAKFSRRTAVSNATDHRGGRAVVVACINNAILWTSDEPRDLDKRTHVPVYRRVRSTLNGSETPTCAAVKQAGAGEFGEAVRLEARRANYILRGSLLTVVRNCLSTDGSGL